MEGLDFSGLTDDQLIALARGCCEEALRRNPAAAAAMQAMMLSEAEKARIARAASEAEIAAARARQRGAIAAAARDEARRAEEKRTAAAREARAAVAAAREAERVQAEQYRDMALLRQAGALVKAAPDKISILYCNTRRGRRVLINEGAYRYAPTHLCDYAVDSGRIKTVAALVPQKPQLAAFSAGIAEQLPLDAFLVGKNYVWPQEPTS